jgi:hypothetical protein
MLNKILCVAILGAFSLLASADAQSAPPATARIKGQIVAARVQGHVTAISKTTLESRVLRDGDQVSEDSIVVTAAGASVILAFSNGATVDLGGDSRLKINEFEQDPFATDLKASEMKQEPGTSATKLYLTKGELVGRVAHLNVDKGSEFTVQTPVGAAGIRGTILRGLFIPLKGDKARISFETFEGLIGYTPAGGGANGKGFILIPAGQKFEAIVDYNPKDPDNPEDWVPVVPPELNGVPLTPAEAAEFQSELQAILLALQDLIFHPFRGELKAGGTIGGAIIDLNSPPLPAPSLNAPTPGAGVP